MTALLAWIDNDKSMRKKTIEMLGKFHEKENRDELGFGGIRDSISDHLFPGTSTLHTRLRYVFFIAWMYKDLEARKIKAPKFSKEADEIERKLIKTIKDNNPNEKGVMGRSAGDQLKNLPSSLYWAALRSWGIFCNAYSIGEYHNNIDDIYQIQKTLEYKETEKEELDTDSDKNEQARTWNAFIPQKPDDFDSKVTFDLTHDEALFIVDQLKKRHPKSLLAYLASEWQPTDCSFPWDCPNYAHFSDHHKLFLKHAKFFSNLAYGASLLYNIQLAELKEKDNLIEEHKKSFKDWVEDIPEGMESWELTEFWNILKGQRHNISIKTKRFVEGWFDFSQKRAIKLMDDPKARCEIKRREIDLKGRNHSRFENKKALDQWGGYSALGKLSYRWGNVKGLLDDLHKGLERS